MWATADARIGSNAGSLVMAIQLLRFVTVGLVSSIECLPDPPRGRGHVDMAQARSIQPRAHTVSMYSLPFDALTSFFRSLQMKTSMILLWGSSMPP
jgi:hypothetical protein